MNPSTDSIIIYIPNRESLWACAFYIFYVFHFWIFLFFVSPFEWEFFPTDTMYVYIAVRLQVVGSTT